jgi:glycosyltransferase involved in cell wall biosynthesis
MINQSLPSVSVVIPVLNEEKYIAKTLQSVLKQKYAGNLEIIVVDGGSEDETLSIVKDFVKEHRWVSLIRNKKKNTPSSLNIGIKKSKGDVFIRLDGHSEMVDDDYISGVVKTLLNNKIGCAGGKTKAVGISFWGKIIAKVFNSIFGVGLSFRTLERKTLVKTLAFGGYWMKDMIQAGYFREDFKCAEDDEYNFRFCRNNKKILYIPKLYIKYYVRESLIGLIKQMFCYGFNKPRTLFKYPEFVGYRNILPLIFILLFSGLVSSIYYKSTIGLLITGMPFLIYILCQILYTLIIVYRNGLKYFLFPLVSGIMHFSYGIGEVAGLFSCLKRFFED